MSVKGGKDYPGFLFFLCNKRDPIIQASYWIPWLLKPFKSIGSHENLEQITAYLSESYSDSDVRHADVGVKILITECIKYRRKHKYEHLPKPIIIMLISLYIFSLTFDLHEGSVSVGGAVFLCLVSHGTLFCFYVRHMYRNLRCLEWSDHYVHCPLLFSLLWYERLCALGYFL